VNTLPQKVILDINVAGSFPIDRALAHQDTSGIIFPHLSRVLLRAFKPIKETAEIDILLSIGTGSNKFSFHCGCGN
jgi:hypothetical protein